MRQDKESFHGVKISRFGIRNGYIDYRTLAQAAGAEPYDMNEDGYWELVNGDDISYSDSEGNVYDSVTAMERVRELEDMVAGAEAGQDVFRWERDIRMLLCVPILLYSSFCLLAFSFFWLVVLFLSSKIFIICMFCINYISFF